MVRLIDANELMEKVKAIRYLRKIKAQKLVDECREVVIVHCNECEYHRNRTNTCDKWNAHTGANGYCYRGRKYGS